MFDASTLVSAAFRRGSIPDLAVRYAFQTDRIAVSEAVMAELLDVLHRPRLARSIDPELRADLLGQLGMLGVLVRPAVPVADCRDPKDDRYLKLAPEAGAETIVSSDDDLLVSHPWRGIRVVRPAECLAQAAEPG